MTTGFTVIILSLVGIIAFIQGVKTMIQVCSEKVDDRVELILAAATCWSEYYGADILITLVDLALFTVFAGSLIGVLAGSAGTGVDFSDTILQAIVAVPWSGWRWVFPWQRWGSAAGQRCGLGGNDPRLFEYSRLWEPPVRALGIHRWCGWEPDPAHS